MHEGEVHRHNADFDRDAHVVRPARRQRACIEAAGIVEPHCDRPRESANGNGRPSLRWSVRALRRELKHECEAKRLRSKECQDGGAVLIQQQAAKASQSGRERQDSRGGPDANLCARPASRSWSQPRINVHHYMSADLYITLL